MYFLEFYGDDDVFLFFGEREKIEEGVILIKFIIFKIENGVFVEKYEIFKKVELFYFLIFVFNFKKIDNVYELCGNVFVVFYMVKRVKFKLWNRNNGGYS